jgi:ankyrin repeat protein
MNIKLHILFFAVCGLLLMQNINAQSTSLIEAVRNNDIKEVKSFIQHGADVNAYDDDSDNVLINAAIYASADCMKLLLMKKADPNLKNKYGQTPLMLCTHELRKMKLLFQYGADINAKSNSQNTALFVACSEYGLYKNIQWLIDNGADPLFKRWGGLTALMQAAPFADTMTIHLLIKKGVEVNAHPWKFSALTNAARYANWPCVISLLNNGADPDILDEVNMPPALWAAEYNNTEVLQLLLQKTKDINIIDSLGGMTPLMWATYNEHDNPQIIQALLDKGAMVNVKDKRGATALSWAMKKGNTATVALLKKYGAE